MVKVMWEKLFLQYGGTLKYPIGEQKRGVFDFTKVTLNLGVFRVSLKVHFGG